MSPLFAFSQPANESQAQEETEPGIRWGFGDWGFGHLRIKTKSKAIVSFAPNEVQAPYLDMILPEWRLGVLTMRGLRELILKARQFGFSTLIAALFFLDTITSPGTGTVIASYDRESSEKLFEMIDRMYRHLPESQRPRTQRSNTRELYWPEIDSHYEVLTAGSKSLGRSWTINNLHVSEYAFWQHPDVIGGLLQAVPAEGNIFIESTANGEGYASIERGETIITGSHYHVYYERAKAGESEYKARFFAWFQHPEYRLQLPSDFKRLSERDASENNVAFERYGDEERLAEIYALDDAQLYWRRRKIDEPGMGPAKFAQEYPANDTEAFRTSGKKFFAGVWNPDIHVGTMEIKPWYTPTAGQDHGYAVPYAWGLGWVFPLTDGTCGFYISDELYAARVRNTEQAAAIKAVLSNRGIDPATLLTLADPAMWAKKGQHQSDNVGRADIEDYWDAGLRRTMKANNNRKHGCTNMREYMLTRGALIIDPSCVNLIRELGLVLADDDDLEVYVSSQDQPQHAVDMLRYLLNSRPRVPALPSDNPGYQFHDEPLPDPSPLDHAASEQPGGALSISEEYFD